MNATCVKQWTIEMGKHKIFPSIRLSWLQSIIDKWRFNASTNKLKLQKWKRRVSDCFLHLIFSIKYTHADFLLIISMMIFVRRLCPNCWNLLLRWACNMKWNEISTSGSCEASSCITFSKRGLAVRARLGKGIDSWLLTEHTELSNPS